MKMKIKAEEFEMEEDYDHEITVSLFENLQQCWKEKEPNWSEIYHITIKLIENLSLLEQAAWAGGDND